MTSTGTGTGRPPDPLLALAGGTAEPTVSAEPPMAPTTPARRRARWYRRSRHLLDRAVHTAHAVHTGVWLGVLDRADLHAVDDALAVERTADRDDRHLERGLYDWEARAVREHFPTQGALLVLAAGAGREVLALARIGYDVTGYECDDVLLRHGRAALARARHAARTGRRPAGAAEEAHLHWCARDRAPDEGGPYDGVIIGSWAYTRVAGRQTRVELLEALADRAAAGAPLLVSFHSREPGTAPERVTTAVAGILRRLRHRPPIEAGDDLAPHFVHRFTVGELAEELEAAGLAVEVVEPPGPGATHGGWAVGRVPDDPATAGAVMPGP